MELRLLGPVQLMVSGRPVQLGPAKQRAVLAALLVDADRPTPAEALIDRVWGDDPPLSVRTTLYSYIAPGDTHTVIGSPHQELTNRDRAPTSAKHDRAVGSREGDART